jgi:hypothetical protein
LNVGLLINELNYSLNTGKATAKTIGYVLNHFIVASSCLSLLLKDLNHQLKKLHNGEDERPEGKASKMISKDHFITSKYWEVNLLIRTMRVVPNAACRCNNKSSSCLYKSITPKSSKYKGIELIKATACIALQTCEDTAT